MNAINKWSLLCLLIIGFSACGKSNASNSDFQAELDKAKEAGKAAFVLVTTKGSANTDKANEVAKAACDIYKNAVIVKMDRDDEANASLVSEWRLAGAPLPIILVVSPKGMLTGGYLLEQATPENIAALIPSAKMEMVYEAIENKKHAIVAFTKESFTDKSEVLKECHKAVTKLNNEAVFIEVDLNDKTETGFMQQIGIDPSMTTSSVTLVINKQGQIAGTSTDVPDADKLVEAANTPVSSGCGPGCGPAGCDK